MYISGPLLGPTTVHNVQICDVSLRPGSEGQAQLEQSTLLDGN